MSKLTLNSNSFKFPYKKDKIIFNAGDTIEISGPNGSGKSSFIESILGVSKHILHQRIQIAYVPQHLVYTKKTVKEFIEYFADLKKVGQKNIDHIVKSFDLERLLNTKFIKTSAGEQKRILLAIGFLKKPGIILLDEFFQNLDVKITQDFKTLFNNLMKTYPELIFIIVTHAFEMPNDFFNKKVIFKEGGEYEIQKNL